MRKITIALILGVVLVVAFLVIAFLYLVLGKPKYEKQDLQNPLGSGNSSNFVVGSR